MNTSHLTGFLIACEIFRLKAFANEIAKRGYKVTSCQCEWLYSEVCFGSGGLRMTHRPYGRELTLEITDESSGKIGLQKVDLENGIFIFSGIDAGAIAFTDS